FGSMNGSTIAELLGNAAFMDPRGRSMALTHTALKALKPKETSYIVSDDRGLYVEVLPTGSIVWRYRYRLKGKREKLTLGKYPALTLKNARLKRDEAAHLVALGQSPAQKKQQEKVAGAEDEI